MAHQTFFKSDTPTRLNEKASKAKADDKHWREVCRVVDVRDGRYCRCCQRKVVKVLAAQPDRLEHHHVVPRSLGGEDTPANVAVVCLECHQRRHVTRELSITGNANGLLTFERKGLTWQG